LKKVSFLRKSDIWEKPEMDDEEIAEQSLSNLNRIEALPMDESIKTQYIGTETRRFEEADR